MLTKALLADSRSRFQAVVAGWDHSVSREAIILYDLFDLQYRSKVQRPGDFKPYPRPWRTRRRLGVTPATAHRILKKT